MASILNFKVRLWLPQGSAETLPRLSDRLFAKDGVCMYMTARCCCAVVRESHKEGYYHSCSKHAKVDRLGVLLGSSDFGKKPTSSLEHFIRQYGNFGHDLLACSADPRCSLLRRRPSIESMDVIDTKRNRQTSGCFDCFGDNNSAESSSLCLMNLA